MTKHFNDAVASIGLLPAEQQDEAARLLLAFIGDDGPIEEIDPMHLDGVLVGINELRMGKAATDDEVEAAFRRFGP